ncbi:acyl-CoA-binding domain-containing protein 4 isoform X1 [Chiloscyllium plagiosum]|uniref:acyl-CoA-binding domain-containing protein 4 isoform X1 n=1 Tax=Chiloscyllium plagiosum TaxID=36176 RepID=UPI001CB7D074|nr:acyl-CoA-binding domain-containing protein 4 isoform X1 [Chiloscyllium plagiosum]
MKGEQPKYFSDFYMLTEPRKSRDHATAETKQVTPSDLTWEIIPQSGYIPSSREGHSMCIMKGKVYLFGGRSHHLVQECLPGMYCFDIESLTWEKLQINGIAPCTLNHSAALVGDNIFVFGGIQNGAVSDNLFMFNTVSLTWTPVKTVGLTPAPRYAHTFAAVGEFLYLFGGTACENLYFKDIHVLDTVSLTWSQCEVKGEGSSGRGFHTFTPHHDKDIYVFGGSYHTQGGNITTLNDVVKLSLAKMKWKMPLYVGIPPERRHSHTAFLLHSHLYIFGGVNEEQEFNDIKAMKLINPSDRQPMMKEILSEFGINEVGYRFSPTRIPKVKYELAVCPFPARADSPPPVPATESRDLSSIYKQAIEMITNAFAMLDVEFQKLDIEKGELARAKIAFQQEKEAYNKQYKNQQQELQEMLEKHKFQNEAWLKTRAEQNDREKQVLFRQRAELLQEQEKLREEQKNLQMRSQQLLSLMQQFKGM